MYYKLVLYIHFIFTISIYFITIFLYLFIYLIIYMYLLSCPSLFCKASLDTLLHILSHNKYICIHTLYEVFLISNMKSILKKIHLYIRFWRNILNIVPITLNTPRYFLNFAWNVVLIIHTSTKGDISRPPPPPPFRSTHVPSLEPSCSLQQSLSRLIFKIWIEIRCAKLPAQRL